MMTMTMMMTSATTTGSMTMTEEELARHDSKTLLQLLLSADARCEALTAERDGLLRCVTDNHVALCRAESAEAERDGYRKALERIAGVKGPYSHPFPESNEGYGSFAIVTAREALKGETP